MAEVLKTQVMETDKNELTANMASSAFLTSVFSAHPQLFE
jgi:hypothetical protein